LVQKVIVLDIKSVILFAYVGELMVDDREYEIERNALISRAEAYADSVAGKRPRKNTRLGQNHDPRLVDWGARWNVAFHGRMNELAKKLL